jgi:hypothetical protein
MKISERAKIFGAFSPLKSFGKALLEKEKIIVPKAELLDDRIEEIEREMQKIKVGAIVSIVHYREGEYEKTVGCVSAFSPEQRYITVIKRKIYFENIYDLRVEEI